MIGMRTCGSFPRPHCPCCPPVFVAVRRLVRCFLAEFDDTPRCRSACSHPSQGSCRKHFRLELILGATNRHPSHKSRPLAACSLTIGAVELVAQRLVQIGVRKHANITRAKRALHVPKPSQPTPARSQRLDELSDLAVEDLEPWIRVHVLTLPGQPDFRPCLTSFVIVAYELLGRARLSTWRSPPRHGAVVQCSCKPHW